MNPIDHNNIERQAALEHLFKVRKQKPFTSVEVDRRIKRGVVKWCARVGEGGYRMNITEFFYPTKDLAVAKAVALVVSGMVQQYVLGRVE